MAHKFRKLDTKSNFPNIDNVEVYKFDNDFDYSRYDYTQMDLQICSVPWDMGEAHVGNRTISGIGNVVYFGSKSARDAWFDAIPDSECFRFSTKFKELHRELAIDVPIPYDVCARFNYLKVHYSLFANDDSPVMYEDETGLRDWFWFIREVEFVAPNTTRLHILDDAFQTWIYDVDITGMVLERGHAPMFAMKADTFLSNPIDNNEYLLTEDVNFGTISNVKHIDVLELNAGNMYACIATTANPNGTWGTKAAGTWQTPASASYTQGGQPSVYVFAVPVANLATLLANITSTCPQFKQTVQGVFFASSDLITLGTTFTFASVTCYNVTSGRKSFDFVNLTKAQFGYETKYANLAKLYTSPYAHIEITDENGNVDIVKVEDTDGTLDVSAALSLAYPFITIDAHVMGVGGNSEVTVTYKNVDSHTFKVSGQWYETLRSWSVPIFAVVLDAATEYDYSTHFDRVQRKNDYDTAYANANDIASTSQTNRNATATTSRDNAYDSADTGKTNADASADAAKTNADASADTAAANVATIATANKKNTDDSADTAKNNVDAIAGANKSNADDSADTAAANVATIAAANRSNAQGNATTIINNAALTTAANTAITTRSNQSADDSSTNTQDYNTNTRAADNMIIALNAASTIAANEQQGNISAGVGMATSAVGAIGSAVSGDFAGAVTGAINGVIGGAGTLASTAVTNSLTASQATFTQALNSAHETVSNTKTSDDTTNQKNTATDLTNTQNTLATGIAANNASVLSYNAIVTETAETTAASATQSTTKNNALNTYNAETGTATYTQTTTKNNALRTQKAENDAAAATQTTTKANATRTQTASKDNATRTKTTSRGNALRSYNTDTANIARDYDTATDIADRDKANAQADVENDILQAALRSPFLYGDFANGESSANKPIALFANVVTQSKAAISSAGDEFLRYGYMLDKYWEFDGNWNIGKYFTYWKLRDFWVTNLNVPDMYMDKLRFFLFGGVTVWRSPHDIGRRTIYDNFS